MNSLKKGGGVSLFNFVGGPGVPLSNFEGDPGVPLLNFEGVPGPESQGLKVSGSGVLVPLLHHAQIHITIIKAIPVSKSTNSIFY